MSQSFGILYGGRVHFLLQKWIRSPIQSTSSRLLYSNTADITNTKKIDSVILDGKYIDSSERQTILERLDGLISDHAAEVEAKQRSWMLENGNK